jgi:ACS family hexuronate transporter-like MFS transporter
MAKSGTERPEITAAAERIGRYRWVICALLFAATAINYVDRQMLGVLEPDYLRKEFHWTPSGYAQIVVYFQIAYAIGYLGFGKVVDWIGARLGYAVAVAVWTLFHVLHGGVASASQFAMVRFGLGIGESGNFPAGVKAVTDWFPQKERALAIGVFNAGSNVGAILTPLIVPAITLAYGWRAAFLATGVVSFIWLAAWLALYRHPVTPSGAGGEVSSSGAVPSSAGDGVAWRLLLARRETWAVAIAKFLTDPVWWMYLFWLPDFLGKRYGLNLTSFGPPLVVIYLMSDIGSVLGGWASSRLMGLGWTPNRARKMVMLICAVAVTPILGVQWVDRLWPAVLLIGMATAAHQAFSANLLTLPSDLFPPRAVGSAVGIAGMAGALGGMMMAKYAGFVLEAAGSYAPIFAVAGSAYLIALLLLHLLSPRLARADLPLAEYRA